MCSRSSACSTATARQLSTATFLESGDYAQIRKTAQVLHGLLGEGAYVKRGEQEHPVSEFNEALDWLLEEVKRGVDDPALQGPGRDEPRAAVGNHHGSEVAPPAAGADRGRDHRRRDLHDADGRQGRAAPRLHRDQRARACATSTSEPVPQRALRLPRACAWPVSSPAWPCSALVALRRRFRGLRRRWWLRGFLPPFSASFAAAAPSSACRSYRLSLYLAASNSSASSSVSFSGSIDAGLVALILPCFTYGP